MNRLLHYSIALELSSPLAIGSGASDDVFDAPCARDGNGLPTIPGTSLAGALRALWSRGHGTESASEWFGTITPGTDAGSRSRLLVSWAHVHDETNRPVDGWVPPAFVQSDSVLRRLVQLPYRDHVRLSHRGGAADKAKFDRSFVPTGCRFTFQLRAFTTAQGCDADAARIRDLLAWLSDGRLRLGGAKAGGYGRCKLVEVQELRFDLAQAGARKAALEARRLNAAPQKASKKDGIEWRDVPASGSQPSSHGFTTLNIELKPRDGWRIGNGTSPVGMLQGAPTDKNPADALPYSETYLAWGKQQRGRSLASWGQHIVVPATALRGPLAHRTVFHFNRLQRRWAGNAAPLQPIDTVEPLFGSVGDGQNGAAGVIFVDDICLDVMTVKTIQLPHVRIDRFTGGAFRGALFSEELLFQGSLPLRVQLDDFRLLALAHRIGHEAAMTAIEALQETLRDLCEERLPIGAGGAHGNGYCRSDWIKQGTGALSELRERVKAAATASLKQEAAA